jgi:hypothetical protein
MTLLLPPQYAGQLEGFDQVQLKYDFKFPM